MKLLRPLVPVLGLVIATGVIAPTLAVAEVEGDFRAAADADLLEVSAVSLPPGCGDESLPLLGEVTPCTFELAQLVLGDTETGVSSASDITYDDVEALSAYGHGSNLDADLLNAGGTAGAISEELLVRSDALQPVGPADDADQLLAFPDNPVLGLELATTEGSAFDVGDGNDSCPTIQDGRATLSHGRNDLVGVRVLPDALGDGQDLAATQDPEQVSYAESRVELVDALIGAADDGVFGLESTATVQLAPVVLFGGAIVVEVTTPKLVGSHDGSAFSVQYTTPIVTVNGETVVDGESIEFLDMLDVPGSPVVTLEVGIANIDDVEVGSTSAAVSGVVTLDLVLGDTLGVASLTLGDLTVAAGVGPDGVTLPGCGDVGDPLREVAKDVSTSEVAPGATFQYVLSVPNRGPCTLTDVTVTDTVSGPDGFTILSSEPAGAIDGDTITWEVEQLDPNETRTFTITVQVPDDAPDGATFDDELTVTGTCDGQPVDGDDRLDDIPVVTAPTVDVCDLSGSNKASSHVEVLPDETFNYYIHAVNGGDVDCGPTTVTDTLPDEVTFVACSDDCAVDGKVVTWQLDGLAAGASRTLTITVAAPSTATGETLPNTATLVPDNGDDVTVTDPGPTVLDESVPAPPDPGRFPPAQDGGVLPDDQSGDLPNTGGGTALVALGLLGTAAWTRRRR